MTALTKMENSVVFMMIIISNFVNALDIWDLSHRHRPEKECYGTSMGFSFSGSHEYHYDSLRRRYDGCTHVSGNLEITNLNNGNVTYDLGFLSKIKVVTGYVLLGLLNVEMIPLKKLKLIRADTTLKIGEHHYGLVVALTSEGIPTAHNPNPGLKELQLPSLREISKGDVIITQNPTLCHIDTINWSLITLEDVKITKNGDKASCSECHADCKDANGESHCWGHGNKMCQKVFNCPKECSGRCFDGNLNGCCHSQCVGECWNGMDSGCKTCRYFRFKHRCVTECPERTYSIGQDCIGIKY